MADTFDAVLAELDKAFGMVACNGSVADPVCNEMKRRLSAAHAAEVAVKKSLAKEVWAAIARAEAAVSGQGVKGWTIQVKRGGPDDELGIWAVAPDGSSIWLAPTQEKGND